MDESQEIPLPAGTRMLISAMLNATPVWAEFTEGHLMPTENTDVEFVRPFAVSKVPMSQRVQKRAVFVPLPVPEPVEMQVDVHPVRAHKPKGKPIANPPGHDHDKVLPPSAAAPSDTHSAALAFIMSVPAPLDKLEARRQKFGVIQGLGSQARVATTASGATVTIPTNM